jgi:hypothetical protein
MQAQSWLLIASGASYCLLRCASAPAPGARRIPIPNSTEMIPHRIRKHSPPCRRQTRGRSQVLDCRLRPRNFVSPQTRYGMRVRMLGGPNSDCRLDMLSGRSACSVARPRRCHSPRAGAGQVRAGIRGRALPRRRHFRPWLQRH